MIKEPYDEVELVAAGARTASFNSDVENVDLYRSLWAFLDVTAASGTSPTLDIKIQEKIGGVWHDTGYAFTQATAVTRERLPMPEIGASQIRAVATIGGTSPSFNFTLYVSGKSE